MQTIIVQIVDGLETLGIFMAILGGLIIVNTLIGSINAWSWGEWKTQKFWLGLLKNILIALTMAIFYVILELMPFAFERAGIIIPSDMVKSIELVGMLCVAIDKYVKDIFTGMLNLLGVTKDEVDQMISRESKG